MSRSSSLGALVDDISCSYTKRGETLTACATAGLQGRLEHIELVLVELKGKQDRLENIAAEQEKGEREKAPRDHDVRGGDPHVAVRELMECCEKLSGKQETFSIKHAVLQDRCDSLETLLIDSADKHAQWEQTHVVHNEKHAQLQEHVRYMETLCSSHDDQHPSVRQHKQHVEADPDKMSVLEDRMDYLETLLEYSADKHARWEKLHAKTASEHVDHDEQQNGLQDRMEHLERLLGESAQMHAKWEQTHLARSEQYALITERVDAMHKRVGDCMENCARSEARIDSIDEHANGLAEKQACSESRVINVIDEHVEECVEKHARWESELRSISSGHVVNSIAKPIRREKARFQDDAFQATNAHAPRESSRDSRRQHTENAAPMRESRLPSRDAREHSAAPVTDHSHMHSDRSGNRARSRGASSDRAIPRSLSPDKQVSERDRDRMSYLENKFWALRF